MVDFDNTFNFINSKVANMLKCNIYSYYTFNGESCQYKDYDLLNHM
jgi:hypothetical protein